MEAKATSPGPDLKNARPTLDLAMAFGMNPTVDTTPDNTLLAKLSVAFERSFTLQEKGKTSKTN